jgi:hypothetical protein
MSVAENFILTAELAKAFVAACRGAGHQCYVGRTGRFAILLNVTKRTTLEPVHHLGADRCYFLGFDDRPFELMRQDPDCIAKLIVATREAEAADV